MNAQPGKKPMDASPRKTDETDRQRRLRDAVVLVLAGTAGLEALSENPMKSDIGRRAGMQIEPWTTPRPEPKMNAGDERGVLSSVVDPRDRITYVYAAIVVAIVAAIVYVAGVTRSSSDRRAKDSDIRAKEEEDAKEIAGRIGKNQQREIRHLAEAGAWAKAAELLLTSAPWDFEVQRLLLRNMNAALYEVGVDLAGARVRGSNGEFQRVKDEFRLDRIGTVDQHGNPVESDSNGKPSTGLRRDK